MNKNELWNEGYKEAYKEILFELDLLCESKLILGSVSNNRIDELKKRLRHKIETMEKSRSSIPNLRTK